MDSKLLAQLLRRPQPFDLEATNAALRRQALADNAPSGSVGAPGGINFSQRTAAPMEFEDFMGALSFAPGIGDAAGLMGDAAMYATKPETRTPGNYALSAMGLLPFVPAASVGKRLSSALQTMNLKPIEIIPTRTISAQEKPFVTVQNGRFVLFHPGFGFESERDVVRKYVENTFPAPKDSGRFFRFTNNADELQLVQNRTIRPSYNWLDKFSEKGLSVAESPSYGITGYKHGYALTGDVIGRGSDGEPLLSIPSIRALSEIRPASELTSEGWDRLQQIKNAFSQTHGVTTDQINKLIRGSYEFVPDGLSETELRDFLIQQTVNLRGPVFRAAGIKGYPALTRDQAAQMTDEFLR